MFFTPKENKTEQIVTSLTLGIFASPKHNCHKINFPFVVIIFD